MSERQSYTIHVCPECGRQITESDYDPKRGRIWGHYHDQPAGWDRPEDPWFEAVAVEIPAKVIEDGVWGLSIGHASDA